MAMEELIIRKGRRADAAALAAVERACFPPEEAASEARIRERAEAWPEHFLLLCRGEEVLAFVDGFCTDTEDLTDEMYARPELHRENGRWQMIFGVNTLPDHRRRGYAGRLLRAFIEEAREQGREGLVLTCKEEKLHYYAGFGFVGEGISASEHGGACWYQMRLRFRQEETPELPRQLGFGFMRLPMAGGDIDIPAAKHMVDCFLGSGSRYFDTAHGYLDGRSETALRECLTSRWPRSAYLLANKLSHNYFDSQEEILPLFRRQLEACGVEYFDYYLMHSQCAVLYEKYTRCRAYETVLSLKEQGLIRHFGISFHDGAGMLERILTDWPQIEFVQIQLNYLDYEDSAVDSRGVYEVCRRFGKQVFVMEPVKGGSLAELPAQAEACLDALEPRGSNASYALRFAGSLPGVAAVLSGMSSPEQLADNVRTFRDFRPLTGEESRALAEVCRVFRSMERIPCTACRYCVSENTCPAGIRIPDVFACYNRRLLIGDFNQEFYYEDVVTAQGGKASDCIGCGGCSRVCPQKLDIPELMTAVAAEFESGGESLRPGVYRHFKGREYRVLFTALHTETEETSVVYQALYPPYRRFVRPLAMFLSEVDHEKYPDAPGKYRFTWLHP